MDNNKIPTLDDPARPGADIDQDLIRTLAKYRTSIAVKYDMTNYCETEKPVLGEGVVYTRENEREGAGRKMCSGVMTENLHLLEDEPLLPSQGLTSIPDDGLENATAKSDIATLPELASRKISDITALRELASRKAARTPTTNNDNNDDIVPPPLPLPPKGFDEPLHSDRQSDEGASRIGSSPGDGENTTSRKFTSRILTKTPTNTDKEVITWSAFEQPKIDYFVIPKKYDTRVTTNQALVSEASTATPSTSEVQQFIREDGAHDDAPLESATREVIKTLTTSDVQQLTREDVVHDGVPLNSTTRKVNRTPTTSDVQQLIREVEMHDDVPPLPPLPLKNFSMKIPLQMNEESSTRNAFLREEGNQILEADQEELTAARKSTTRPVNRMMSVAKRDKGELTWGPFEQPTIPYFVIPKKHKREGVTFDGASGNNFSGVQQLTREDGAHDGIPLDSTTREVNMTPTTSDVQQLIREVEMHDDVPLDSSTREVIMTPTTSDVQQLIRANGAHDGFPLDATTRVVNRTPTTSDVQHLIREVEMHDDVPRNSATKDVVKTTTTSDVQQLIREVEMHDDVPPNSATREFGKTTTTSDVQQLVREDGMHDGVSLDSSTREVIMTPTTSDVQQLIREDEKQDDVPLNSVTSEVVVTPTTGDVQQFTREADEHDGIPPPPPLPAKNYTKKIPLHMEEDLSTGDAFLREEGNVILGADKEESTTRPVNRSKNAKRGKNEITWCPFEQPTIPYFVIPKKHEKVGVASDRASGNSFSQTLLDILKVRTQPYTHNDATGKLLRKERETCTEPEETARRSKSSLPRYHNTLKQEDPSPDDILRYLEKSIDVIKEEVRQECIAKGMRPQFIGDLYLTRLAKARKTAAETKAKKPEPRVKIEKPVHLDTDLMYAVRQKVKETLPKFIGKNNSAAIMLMADGMFQEMSLDRELDDLAWPHDPLAELKQSGLGNVDYMEPTQINTATKYEVLQSVPVRPSQCEDVTEEVIDPLDRSLDSQQAASMQSGSYSEESPDSINISVTHPGQRSVDGKTTDVLIDDDLTEHGVAVLDELPLDKEDTKNPSTKDAVPDMTDSEVSQASIDESILLPEDTSPLDVQASVIPVDELKTASEGEWAAGDLTSSVSDSGSIPDVDDKKPADDYKANEPDLYSDVDSALSDDDSVVSYVSYLGIDDVPATNEVMRKINLLERKSSLRSFGSRRASDDSMTLLDDSRSTSSDSSGYGEEPSTMCVRHKIKYFNKMKRSWQTPLQEQTNVQVASVGNSTTSVSDDHSASDFHGDDSSMEGDDVHLVTQPLTPSTQQLDEEPAMPTSVTSRVTLFEQLAAEDKHHKPCSRINATNGSSGRGDAMRKISLFEEVTNETSVETEQVSKPAAAADRPSSAVDVKRRVSMFETMKSEESSPAISRPIAARRKNGGSVFVGENRAFYGKLGKSVRERREDKSAL